MFTLNDIKHLHLEISSYCNARCPLCPRNLFGYPFNGGYRETHLSLDLIKKRFSSEFISGLNEILFNGNFGDFQMNPEAADIVAYFRLHNPKLKIAVSTNGSARDNTFWASLAQYNIKIEFCLDGMDDTHHLYRQDTDWHKILQHARAFIDAGGHAIWKMIPFEHNKHQIEQCKDLSHQLGFSQFKTNYDGRDTGPVFNREGKRIHTLGNPKPLTNFKNATHAKLWNEQKVDYSFPAEPVIKTEPFCKIKRYRSIFIAANGLVYPCCFLGFSPETYTYGYLGSVNEQIKQLMNNNSLHDYDLETCIQWLKKVEESWSIASYAEGRTYQCDFICGQHDNR